MEKKKDISDISEFKKKEIPYSAIVVVYVGVAILGMLFMVHMFSKLMEQHDQRLTVDINSLIAEKMNHSLEYMIESVNEMGDLLSVQKTESFDGLYEELLASKEKSDYVSIGLIDNEHKMYGTEVEQEEFAKWDLLKIADLATSVTISEPYRSAMTGKIVFTVFTPIYENQVKRGTLFVTYPLSEIQNIANTDVLKDEAEIYLMNAYSDNSILCSGSNPFMIGNWNNAKLYKNQVKTKVANAYVDWEKSMQTDQEIRSVVFDLNDVTYTQVYEPIAAMKGWFVVVRIPNSSLSGSMKQFRLATIIYILVILITSMILFFILHRRDMEEKDIFRQLSIYDSLTQILNRRAFEIAGRNYFTRNAEKYQGALIFLDIDYFKQVNDTLGHDAGDRLLVGFANALKEVFEEHDLVARLGGDEFVVLVKNMRVKEDIDKKLDRLRDLVSAIDISEEDKQLPFGLHYSAGAVAFPDCGKEYDDLVKYADDALYEVKEKGRDGYQWYVKSAESVK